MERFLNNYHNITSLVMSAYKWLIEKHPNIRFFKIQEKKHNL